jgi:hypothetical protein
MHSGQLVFAQVMAYLPLKAFSRMVAARRVQQKVQDFSCLDQLLVRELNMFEMTSIETLFGQPVEPTELSDYPVKQELFQT